MGEHLHRAVALLLAGALVTPVSADEQEAATRAIADPAIEERENAQQRAKEAQQRNDKVMRESREQTAERGPKAGKENRGQEKQRERVMEQEQKELGKGSEQGQESREQRRKWWRFWE